MITYAHPGALEAGLLYFKIDIVTPDNNENEMYSISTCKDVKGCKLNFKIDFRYLVKFKRDKLIEDSVKDVVNVATDALNLVSGLWGVKCEKDVCEKPEFALTMWRIINPHDLAGFDSNKHSAEAKIQLNFSLKENKLVINVDNQEIIGKLGLIGSTELNLIQSLTEKAPTVISQFGAT